MDVPYRVSDVVQEFGVSERELLLHGIEGRLQFYVSLQDVTVEWWARYHANKGETPVISSREILRMIRDGEDVQSYTVQQPFEEPWHSEDVRGRKLFPVSPLTLESILAEGSGELQLAVPDDPDRKVPDPPPDEIVTFVCPFGGTRTAGTLDKYRQCDTNSLLIQAEDVERVTSEADIDEELFDLLMVQYDLNRAYDALACMRPTTPTDWINRQDRLKQIADEKDQIQAKIDRKKPLTTGPEPAGTEVEGNYFKLDKHQWYIRYNNNEIIVKDNVNIRAIAERLRYPNEEKQFASFRQVEEHEATPLKHGQKSQNCYEVIDDKGKKELEQRSRELHDRLEKMLPGTDELAETEGKIAKLKKFLRTEYNAVLLDDGSIKWGNCSDKSERKKQEDTHRRQLKRGIAKIRDEKHYELAEHLEKFLLKENYYNPPPDAPPWEIIY